jgi:saccharopine dehydrogenase-like NADP-dependent oxidoreductase
MKVLVLGTGGMGIAAAKTVAEFNEITELTVADRNEKAARECAAYCGPHVQFLTLDVTDTAALREALSQVDVVLNCVGPFFRFGVPILTAAIESKTHYLDICDDPEPTLEMLELDALAREKNVLAIIGMGASPGISNLLAAKVCTSLDTIDELITGWNIDVAAEEEEEESLFGSENEASAAVVHWMEQCSGVVQSWVSNELKAVKPLQPLKVDYPGIGKRTLWTVGHPEPVTLPRTFPNIANTSNAMVVAPLVAFAVRDLASKIDAGKLTVEEAALEVAKSDVAGRNSIIEKAIGWVLSKFSGPQFPPIFALGKGKAAGRSKVAAATIRAMPAGGMAGATGIPLAVALKLMAQGAIKGGGVVTPEAVIDPDTFFEAFAPFCTIPAPVQPRDLVDFSLR